MSELEPPAHTHTQKKTKSFDIWKTCLRPIAFSFSFSLNLMAGFFSSRFTPSPFLFPLGWISWPFRVPSLLTERVAKKSSENGSSIDTRTVTKGKEVGEREKQDFWSYNIPYRRHGACLRSRAVERSWERRTGGEGGPTPGGTNVRATARATHEEERERAWTRGGKNLRDGRPVSVGLVDLFLAQRYMCARPPAVA